VEATWQEPNGRIFREAGHATEVNDQGGLLEMKTYPAVGTQIEITNLLSHESSHARVVGVAVELVVPSDTFWGVNFQLKKACADLVKLEYDMRSGSVDQRVLSEFRDAVDNVRKTAWAVQEWQERQSRRQDPLSVLPLLTAERIRRATQLCEAITGASTTQGLTRHTVGIEEFLRAIERVHQNLLDLFKDREP
jgi:dihydropteroate synthase